MRIVYQQSIVNPQVFVPICHINSDVGEHVLILRNPERAVSVRSLLRYDGGVDHPLLGDTVFNNLHSIGSLPSPIPEITTSTSNYEHNQIMVTPPRRSGRSNAAHMSFPWKPKMSLALLDLLSLFEITIGKSMEEMSFAPMGMSFQTIFRTILISSAGTALAFVNESRQRALDQNDHGSTIQHQVLSFLHELHIGPDMECFLSTEYPSFLIMCPDTSSLTRVLTHPQYSIFSLEKHLFLGNNPHDDWTRLLANSSSIGDNGPYSLRMNRLEGGCNEREMIMYNVACSYLSSMRRSIKSVIDKHGVAPFNVGFALDIWLHVIHNLEEGLEYTMGITADALQLVKDIFEFFEDNSTAWSCGESPTLVFTCNGVTVAWLVHPVERGYLMF